MGVSFTGIAKKSIDLLNAKLNETETAMDTIDYESSKIVCSGCGNSISCNAKFCPECGLSTQQLQPGKNPVHAAHDVNNVNTDNQTIRQSTFVGLIQRCPNCGASIDATDAICSECGYKISGRRANGIVARFSEQLLAIEQGRKGANVIEGVVEGLISTGGISRTDKQIIALINTFPIPNNVEELSEFMFMATSNIDARLSKKTLLSVKEKNGESAISDAWVSKMKQIYNKAKMAFPDDGLFAQIEHLYLEKMNELNMKA